MRPEELTLDVEDAVNNVGNWKLSLRAEHPLADHLRTPGAGIIITGPGDVIMSGPVTTPEYAATPEDPAGSVSFEGVSDSVLLADMLAFPEPANPDPTKQALGHDERTGRAESVMHAYVAANIGPSAPAPRRRANLVMGADGGRGPVVTKSARFPTLGELLTEIATMADLRFRIVQRGSRLQFETYVVEDRRKEIRLDTLNGSLAGHRVTVSPPGATRVIVAGQGELTDRHFLAVDNAASIAAEDEWNRRVERFVDQRQTNDDAELAQAGNELLAESGFTSIAVQAVPTDDSAMVFGIDWNLGDRVTVVAGGQELASVVTGLRLLADEDGFRLGALLGDPSGFTADAMAVKKTQAIEARVSSLERTAEPTPAGAAELDSNVVVQATHPDAYPVGESFMYVTGAQATAGGWDFGGRWGFVETRKAPNGDVYQRWSRVHAAATPREDWVRGGNRSSGWAPWRQLAYKNILPSEQYTNSTPASAYPYEDSRIYVSSVHATANGWSFAPSSGFVWTSATTTGHATQRFSPVFTSGVDIHEEWVRHGSPTAWTPWRKTAWTDNTPRGIVALTSLPNSDYVADVEQLVFTMPFTAEADRCYKVSIRVPVVDTDSTGDSSARVAKQSAMTYLRWAPGTSVSTSSTAVGSFYSTTFNDDSMTGTGLDASFYINRPPAGRITIGVGLMARRTAATYGRVRYLASTGSSLAVEDVGAAVA
ncbi:siphovirus ReqiPepy6 Gp37-like family protein [Streptomyces sp. DT117]|uniref:siphovirus ReqiPepy6 Gp37-like family protein n=1 Tax=Streptomyces sp. DT117 TaxID=3393422 RepID=UPI003CF25601